MTAFPQEPRTKPADYLEPQHASEMTRPVRVTSLLRQHEGPPRLLVSVRSSAEVLHAIEGGAEIIDIKEPTRGSLGMASIDQMTQIASGLEFARNGIPLSAALGEVSDWPQTAAAPRLPDGISFAKLGLNRCASSGQWRTDLRNVRDRFERQSSSRLRWVAVAYADAEQAQSPSVRDILDEAIESECAGLLIDTWSKAESTLLNAMEESALIRLANDCHAAGLFFALAGKLRRDSLPRLANVAVDVIAIRSAACLASDRTSQIHRELVTEFKGELGRCFREGEASPGGRGSRRAAT